MIIVAAIVNRRMLRMKDEWRDSGKIPNEGVVALRDGANPGVDLLLV
jgi:hypothetical protein